MENQNYYLGLDIGTGSVGWAVTDCEYNVIKKHGKALWGVRLFDSADTAAERRGFRTARRRLQRRKQRLQWLQELFSEEIAKVDPGFFYRLRESKFLEEDKQADFPLGRYTLFADKNYNDKDYHRDYPTIYHLRKALIKESEKTFDVRLVYLALHHIFKHRGHFLMEGSLEAGNNFNAAFERLQEAMRTILATSIEDVNKEELRTTLLAHTTKNDRANKLQSIFSATKTLSKPEKTLLNMLTGKKVSLKDIFEGKSGLEELPQLSLDSDLEELKEILLTALEDDIELILAVKGLYDWAKLETMCNGESYLSYAKVKSYNKHQKDLRILKSLVKNTLSQQQYRDFFYNKNSENNYAAYCGHKTNQKACGYESFTTELKKLLNSIKNEELCETIDQIYAEIDAGSFLPKQTGSDNIVIPHQLHENELVKILENASKYLPFLNQKDESGLDKKEQIHQMFCFKIPYYVGPLNSHSKHAWIVREEDQKIYPWNFTKIINLEKSREKFITRATATCSYIGEPVLPKNSLLYSKFTILNIINKLKINGHNITVEQKQGIYKDLCLENKSVTVQSIATYLGLEQQDELSGFDQEIKVNLKSLRHFSWLLEKDNGEKIAEDIILHITLFGEDRRLLNDWLNKTYNEQLAPEEIKTALTYRCSGWGRLSQVFLEEIYHVDPTTGEAFSLMDMLWNTNANLMELLSQRYNFGEAVARYRKEKFAEHSKTLQDYLDESYASPAVKRAIHQTIKIVAEIKKIMKAKPTRIFLEMAREDQEKGKRTVSRHKHLRDLYAASKKEYPDLLAQLERETDANLRRDKLYLYYIQLGKCMYSGEIIDLNRLDRDYDIDHIYPQSQVKDDSLDNRVLVKKNLNFAKSNTYPLTAEIRQKMCAFWNALAAKKFISEEKLKRLKRAEKFTLEEKAGFIARQLVETRQSSKIIAELLQENFKNTEIVYVKAANVSNFRQQQRLQADDPLLQEHSKLEAGTTDPLFLKCREFNDYHHAKDAYLNVVVGNVYYTKFTGNPLVFLRGETNKYSLNRMFDFEVKDNKVVAWKPGADGSIAAVRRMMSKNNILFTRRASEESGGLFDQQIVSCKAGQIPLKAKDERYAQGRYGQYNKAKGTFFCLVEHTEKKKRIRSLESVLLMYRQEYLSNPLEYCQKRLGLEDPKIIIPKIKINALFSIDGARMHISGRSGDRIIYKNADQLILNSYWQMYLKRVYKYLGRKNGKAYPKISEYDGISCEENIELYRILKEKITLTAYKSKYEAARKHLEDKQEIFAALGCSEQCQVLAEIMKLFSASAAKAKLELIKAGKSPIGEIRFSKKIRDKKYVLIHQSVTGFFEQEIDLLTAE